MSNLRRIPITTLLGSIHQSPKSPVYTRAVLFLNRTSGHFHSLCPFNETKEHHGWRLRPFCGQTTRFRWLAHVKGLMAYNHLSAYIRIQPLYHPPLSSCIPALICRLSQSNQSITHFNPALHSYRCETPLTLELFTRNLALCRTPCRSFRSPILSVERTHGPRSKGSMRIQDKRIA